MNKTKFIFALVLFNVAAFILSTLFLPSAGSFMYGSPFSYYINSRTDWHISFVVLVATTLISWGVYLTIAAFSESSQSSSSEKR